MKRLLLIITLAILTSRCIPVKKYDRSIENYYAKQHKNYAVRQGDSLKLDLVNEADTLIDAFSRTVKNKQIIVPLILYNFAKQKNQSRINPAIYLNFFREYYGQLAASPSYSEKLRDKRIEITFNKIPNRINTDYQQHSVLIILYFYTVRHHSFYYKPQELQLHYKIKDIDNNILKEGDFSEILDEDNGGSSALRTLDKFMELSLATFDRGMEILMKKSVSAIFSEL